eukprot:1323088-Amorphochlora_amoeboformis.AAC.1
MDEKVGEWDDGMDEGMGDGMEYDEEDEKELSGDDVWEIIGEYFKRNGLCKQQLDSYDEFVNSTMRDILVDSRPIELFPEPDMMAEGSEYKRVKHSVKFDQISIGVPEITEADGGRDKMWPNLARLRGMTYSAPLYVDIKHTVETLDEDTGEVIEGTEVEEELPKKFMGKVPIMLRSHFCLLRKYHNKGLNNLGECEYDQGGYFIINGSEKVIVAQERMSSNHVYIFSGREHRAEIRSQEENSSSPPSSFFIRLVKPPRTSQIIGKLLKAQIPYVHEEVPVMILFRALGIVPDGSILEYICYTLNDRQMLEMLKPSLEEASSIETQELALDYLGRRASAPGTQREQRIAFAKDLLQRNFLPHVGVLENQEAEKAYFIG